MTTSTLTDTFATTGCRPVIINVDDLGLSDPVNEAVITLAQLGRVSASSYMVGGNITESQLKSLAMLHLDIGLHLDFTGVYSSPLKNKLSNLLLSSYLRKIDIQQVKDIINQQFDEFEDIFNHPPVFVDGHQHVHQFPIIRQCLIDVIRTRYVTQMGSPNQASHTTHQTDVIKRTPPPIGARVTTPLVNDMKSWTIYLLGGASWQRLCQQHDLPTNSKLGGVYDFDASQDELTSLWQQWFSHCPLAVSDLTVQDPVPLIMCHPAKVSADWQDDIKAAREQEYRWMVSDDFKALCDRYFIDVVKWSRGRTI